MVRYRDLNSACRKTLCNGCGGKGSFVDPPDFCFTASCDHHDFNYALGGLEKDRLKADRQFLKAMKQDTLRLTGWWRRTMAWLAAHWYYFAVRRFGKPYFTYRPAGSPEPTLQQLLEEAKDRKQ